MYSINNFYSLVRTYVSQELFDRGRPLRFVKRRLNRKRKIKVFKTRLWSFIPKLSEKGNPVSFPSVVPLRCFVGPTSFILEDLINDFEFDQILLEQPKTLELKNGFPSVEIFRPCWRTSFHRRAVFLKNIVSPAYLNLQKNNKSIKLLIEYKAICIFLKIKNLSKWWKRIYRKPKCFHYLGIKVKIPNRYFYYYIKSIRKKRKKKLKACINIKILLWYRIRSTLIHQFNMLFTIRILDLVSISFPIAFIIFIHRLCRWLKPVIFFSNRKKFKNYNYKKLLKSNFLVYNINLVKYLLFIYTLSDFDSCFFSKEFLFPKMVNGSLEIKILLSKFNEYPKKLIFDKFSSTDSFLINSFYFLFFRNFRKENLLANVKFLIFNKNYNCKNFIKIVLLKNLFPKDLSLYKNITYFLKINVSFIKNPLSNKTKINLKNLFIKKLLKNKFLINKFFRFISKNLLLRLNSLNKKFYKPKFINFRSKPIINLRKKFIIIIKNNTITKSKLYKINTIKLNFYKNSILRKNKSKKLYWFVKLKKWLRYEGSPYNKPFFYYKISRFTYAKSKSWNWHIKFFKKSHKNYKIFIKRRLFKLNKFNNKFIKFNKLNNRFIKFNKLNNRFNNRFKLKIKSKKSIKKILYNIKKFRTILQRQQKNTINKHYTNINYATIR